MPRFVRMLSLRLLLASLLGLCLVGTATAQIQFGQIQGVVTSQDSGRPLAGTTVVVTGPALQGDQSEVTDRDGRYLITQLPPGDHYTVRFYFNDVVVEHFRLRGRRQNPNPVFGAVRAKPVEQRSVNIHVSQLPDHNHELRLICRIIATPLGALTGTSSAPRQLRLKLRQRVRHTRLV